MIRRTIDKVFVLSYKEKMELKASKGKIVITPVKKSILDYAGKYHYLINKTNQKINLERLRDYIDYSDL